MFKQLMFEGDCTGATVCIGCIKSQRWINQIMTTMAEFPLGQIMTIMLLASEKYIFIIKNTYRLCVLMIIFIRQLDVKPNKIQIIPV